MCRMKPPIPIYQTVSAIGCNKGGGQNCKNWHRGFKL